jgi:hypothetical protein
LGQWKKAIRAKAFDIARSLIPAGTTTLVAWSTNLRQADDHTKEMRHHALPEIREIGSELHSALKEKYPSSFSHERNQAEEDYVERSMKEFSFYDVPVTDFGYTNRIDKDALLDRAGDLIRQRPKKAELHQRLRRYGSIDFAFKIDFGSFRDIQRQRSAVQEMPLLTTKLGFHPWYLANLPDWVHKEIKRLEERVNALNTDAETRQYYIPMGYQVPEVMSCTLPSAVYIAELRSGTTVHPTLRIRAQQMGEAIKECVPGIAMHHDLTPVDSWDIRRGAQDIVEKETR